MSSGRCWRRWSGGCSSWWRARLLRPAVRRRPEYPDRDQRHAEDPDPDPADADLRHEIRDNELPRLAQEPGAERAARRGDGEHGARAEGDGDRREQGDEADPDPPPARRRPPPP